jgi:hypothetical protein
MVGKGWASEKPWYWLVAFCRWRKGVWWENVGLSKIICCWLVSFCGWRKVVWFYSFVHKNRFEIGYLSSVDLNEADGQKAGCVATPGPFCRGEGSRFANFMFLSLAGWLCVEANNVQISSSAQMFCWLCARG